MSNRYCNLVGTNKIKDEYTKINDGFDTVEQEMDAALSAAQAAQATADAALPRTGGTVTGRVIAELGFDGAYSWGTFSSSTNGNTMIAQNAYIHPTDATYRYRATHESIGARGIVFLWSTPAQAAVPHWFDMGRIATTANATFTPTLIPIITSAGGQTINGPLTIAGGIGNGIQFSADDSTAWFRVYGSANQIWFARVGGSNEVRFRVNALIDELVVSSAGQVLRVGAGSPEGVVAAPVGSIYQRTDGGASTTLYVKESGTGNTGWKAVQTA